MYFSLYSLILMIKYVLTSSPHPLFFREISFFFCKLIHSLLKYCSQQLWKVGCWTRKSFVPVSHQNQRSYQFFEMPTSRDQIIWLQGGPIISRCTLLGLIVLKDTLFIVNLKQLSAWIIPQKAFHLFLTLRELFQDVDIKIYNFYKIRKERKFKI